MSAVEIQAAVTTPLEYKDETNELHRQYCEYKGMGYQPVFAAGQAPAASTAPVPPVAPAPAPAPVAQATPAPVEPSFNDDDIPF